MLWYLANRGLRALKLVACLLLSMVLILMVVVSIGCLATGDGIACLEGVAAIGDLVATLFQDVIASDRNAKRVA